MTTWLSWHQKGKIILDFNEARDDRVAVASAGPYASHSRPITMPAPHHSIFNPLDALCDAQSTVLKHHGSLLTFWRFTNRIIIIIMQLVKLK